jgi:hypothetical protein
MATYVQARLTGVGSRLQRAQHALQLLLGAARTNTGHLVLFDTGGSFVAASIGQDLPTPALLIVVERHLEAELRDAQNRRSHADLRIGDAGCARRGAVGAERSAAALSAHSRRRYRKVREWRRAAHSFTAARR